jgi:hypothetical protein
MKKVLLIKLEAPSYSSIGMENAFKEAFEEVHSIDWQRINFNTGGKGLWPEIYTKCLEVIPDLIICQFQKPNVLTLEQFKKLSKFGFVINYTEDVREDTTWYEEVAPHIGLTLFTNYDDMVKLTDKGFKAASMFVPYNDEWYKPQPKTEKYYGDIIFIGNNYTTSNLNFPYAQERQDMIKFMKYKFGDKFQCYGMGQENQILSPSQCIEAYNNTKVVITQNNFKRRLYMSDRGLNAMACGADTLLQYFNGIEKMFNDAPCLHSWMDFDHLEIMCKGILLINENYEKNFRLRMTDYIKKDHSWRNRVKFIKGFIEVIKHPEKYTEATLN